MIDPRLRILYLVAISVGVFFLPWPAVAALLLLQIGLWLRFGLGTSALVRQIVKFAAFAAFLVVSYALGGLDSGTPWQWVRVGPLWVSTESAIVGAIMAMRVLCVILTSQVARAGDPRAIAVGLERLGVPKIVSTCIDVVLALL